MVNERRGMLARNGRPAQVREQRGRNLVSRARNMSLAITVIVLVEARRQESQ
jgi:hypothetical protein